MNTFTHLVLIILSHTWRYVMTSNGSCVMSYSASNGRITSPRYPSAYDKDLYCVNIIRLPVGKRIHLKWQTFHVPGEMPHCIDDYVRITRCTSPLKYLIRYCGTSLPNDIYSYDNCLRVEFRSSYGSARSTGIKRFKLQYDTLDVSKPLVSPPNCFSLRKYSDNNILNIYTPNWPLSYSGLLPVDGCKTRVYYRSDLQTKIYFMSIDLHTPQQDGSPCMAESNDILKLTLVTTQGEDVRYNYCFRQKPFTVFYGYDLNYIDILLKPGTTQSHNNKGFVITILKFPVAMVGNMPNEEDSSLSLQSKLGIVITVIWLLGFGLLAFFGFMTRGGNVVLQPHVPITAGVYTLPAPTPYQACDFEACDRTRTPPHTP